MPTAQQIIVALEALTPGAIWTLTFNADQTWALTWLDTTQTQPTNAAILAQVAALLAAQSK